jgi:hypothetical protein
MLSRDKSTRLHYCRIIYNRKKFYSEDPKMSNTKEFLKEPKFNIFETFFCAQNKINVSPFNFSFSSVLFLCLFLSLSLCLFSFSQTFDLYLILSFILISAFYYLTSNLSLSVFLSVSLCFHLTLFLYLFCVSLTCCPFLSHS